MSSLLTTLALRALLTLLASLALLPLLALLRILGQLFHLLLQLFRLATQHLLLPALLKTLLRIVLCVGQLFLPLGQCVQLLQRALYILGMLLSGRRGLRRLILVLFRIQFKIEQACKIAARTAAATTTATLLLAKRYLYLAKRRLGTQQRLQRLLLQRQRVFPLRTLQLVCRGRHRRGCCLHIFFKRAELFIGRGQIAALHARRQRHHLVSQLHLRIRQKDTGCRDVFRRRILIVLLLPCSGNQLFLALGDFCLIALRPTTSATTAATLLRLRKLALKGLCLDKCDLRLRLCMAIACCCVQAHQVTRHQLEILKPQHVRALAALRSLRLQQAHILLCTTVDGVVQMHIAQAKLGTGLHADRYFFDRTRTVIAARPINGNRGWCGLVSRNKVVL